MHLGELAGISWRTETQTLLFFPFSSFCEDRPDKQRLWTQPARLPTQRPFHFRNVRDQAGEHVYLHTGCALSLLTLDLFWCRAMVTIRRSCVENRKAVSDCRKMSSTSSGGGRARPETRELPQRSSLTKSRATHSTVTPMSKRFSKREKNPWPCKQRGQEHTDSDSAPICSTYRHGQTTAPVSYNDRDLLSEDQRCCVQKKNGWVQLAPTLVQRYTCPVNPYLPRPSVKRDSGDEK